MSEDLQAETLSIMKRVCRLFAELEFKFETVLFEEMKRQMIEMYLKREAVKALSKEFNVLISKQEDRGAGLGSSRLIEQSDDVIEKMKLKQGRGLRRRNQGGVLRLDSKHLYTHRVL